MQGKNKKRIRRSAEEARREILATAESLFVEKGPDGVRLSQIAERMGVSHGTLLYHFKTTELLREALFQEISLSIRNELLVTLAEDDGMPLIAAFNQALKRISSPQKAPMLAWLLASGHEPFPDVAEEGLGQVAGILSEKRGVPLDESKNLILLSVLAMFGECLVGGSVRARLGLENDEKSQDQFRMWMLSLVGREVASKGSGSPTS